MQVAAEIFQHWNILVNWLMIHISVNSSFFIQVDVEGCSFKDSLKPTWIDVHPKDTV